MQSPEVIGSLALLIGALWLTGWELRGVLLHKATITGDWRFADRWLQRHSVIADWLYRIFTIGILTWATLHFAVGIR